MENIVIGIEGLVGSGKTSICRQLIKIIPNSVLLNGGNMYRAIVYALTLNNTNLENVQNIDIKAAMDLLKIELKIENNETVFYLNNEKLKEENLQSKEASLAVSKVGGVANNSKLFEFARGLIENLKLQHNLVISGRGLIQIYPQTDYHLFITASLEERVNRKCTQYENKEERAEIERNIIQRDSMQEKAGFYNLSPKTIVIDVTNCKTVEESTNKVLAQIGLK